MITIVIKNNNGLLNTEFKYVKDNIFFNFFNGGYWDANEEAESISGSLVTIGAHFRQSFLLRGCRCGAITGIGRDIVDEWDNL